MRWLSLVLLGIALAGGAGFLLQRQSAEALRAELTLLREENRELSRLRAENLRLVSLQVSAAELERLRADHAALARLKAEIEKMKARTAQAAP